MAWQISGQYMETCSCTFLCPCITTNLAGMPTEGNCQAALGLHIDKGSKDGVSLDGLNLVMLLESQGPMGAGNMTVGLIVDDTASQGQVDAIAEIAAGKVGGPMAMLAPLVGRFAGVERAPVTITRDGNSWSVRAGGLIDQACDALPNMDGQPIYLDNVSHPMNSRLGLAKATRSNFDAFGIQWSDDTGTRNGHFAPFSWSG
jgi:hypothetical protein